MFYGGCDVSYPVKFSPLFCTFLQQRSTFNDLYRHLSEITPKGHKTTRIKSVNHPTKFHNGVYLHWGHSKIDNILLMNCRIEYPLKNIKKSVLVFVNKRTAFVINGTLGKLTMCVIPACLCCNFVFLFYLI